MKTKLTKTLTFRLMAAMAACLVVLSIPSCTTPEVVTQPDGTVSTNAVVDARLVAAVIAAKAANAATAPVNPFSGLIELGLGAVAVGAGWVAKRKNDKAAANALLLKTVIQAIDALDSSSVKDAIQSHAVKIGVEGELNTVVKQVNAGSI
jgi:hypothetical protein